MMEVCAVTFDEQDEAFRVKVEPRVGKFLSFSQIPEVNSTGDEETDSFVVRSMDGVNPEAICAEMSESAMQCII